MSHAAAAAVLGAALAWVATGASAQNLLVSPDFDTAGEIADWPDPFPDPGTTISWRSDLDVDGSPSSGSLQLDNSIDNGAFDGPFQCVAAGAGFYEVSAWFFNPTQSPQPVVLLGIEYYASADCTGPDSGFDSLFGGSTLDAWAPILEEAHEVPAGTGSLGLRLFSGGTVDPTTTTVSFDAVYLPEPVGPAGLAFGALLLAGAARRRRRA